MIQSLKTLSYNTVYKPQDEQFNVISYASIDNYENVFDKYEFFFEDFQEQKFLKIKSLETNETVLQYHDTFINNSSHMNISDNGSFVVISYDNGMVSVFHILYSNCLRSYVISLDILKNLPFNSQRNPLQYINFSTHQVTTLTDDDKILPPSQQILDNSSYRVYRRITIYVHNIQMRFTNMLF